MLTSDWHWLVGVLGVLLAILGTLYQAYEYLDSRLRLIKRLSLNLAFALLSGILLVLLLGLINFFYYTIGFPDSNWFFNELYETSEYNSEFLFHVLPIGLMFGFPIGILIGFATTRTKVSFLRNPPHSVSIAVLGLLVLPGFVTALWFLEPLLADPWQNVWDLLSIIASLGGFGYGLLVNQSLSSNKRRFVLSLASVYIRGILLLLLFTALITVLNSFTNNFPPVPESFFHIPWWDDNFLLSAARYFLPAFLFWFLLGLMLNRSNLGKRVSKITHPIGLLCLLILTGIFTLVIGFPFPMTIPMPIGVLTKLFWGAFSDGTPVILTLSPIVHTVSGFILLLIGMRVKQKISGFKLKYKYMGGQLYPLISWKRFFSVSFVIFLFVSSVYMAMFYIEDPCRVFCCGCSAPPLSVSEILYRIYGVPLFAALVYGIIFGTVIGSIYSLAPWITHKLETLLSERRLLGQIGLVLTILGILITVIAH